MIEYILSYRSAPYPSACPRVQETVIVYVYRFRLSIVSWCASVYEELISLTDDPSPRSNKKGSRKDQLLLGGRDGLLVFVRQGDSVLLSGGSLQSGNLGGKGTGGRGGLLVGVYSARSNWCRYFLELE